MDATAWFYYTVKTSNFFNQFIIFVKILNKFHVDLYACIFALVKRKFWIKYSLTDFWFCFLRNTDYSIKKKILARTHIWRFLWKKTPRLGLFLFRSQRLFNVVEDAQETTWVPRAILSDLEPGTMDAVRLIYMGVAKDFAPPPKLMWCEIYHFISSFAFKSHTIQHQKTRDSKS